MAHKYISPFTGKKITPHQFLAGMIFKNNEDAGIILNESKKRSQYVAAAKIAKIFIDDIDEIIRIVAKEQLRSLFPLVWKDFTPLKRKLKRIDQDKEYAKMKKKMGSKTGIEKL